MGSKWMYQVGTWSVAGALFYAFVYLKDRKARVVDPKDLDKEFPRPPQAAATAMDRKHD